MQRILIEGEVLPSWNLLYAGKHWTVRKKIADHWHELIFYTCKQQKIKSMVGLVDITVICKFKGRQLDADNLCTKISIDPLKTAGILKDDSPKYVNSVTTCSRKGKTNSTEIILEYAKE